MVKGSYEECLKCLTAGLKVAACLTHRSITLLKTSGSLRILSQQTSLLKALTRPEDGKLINMSANISVIIQSLELVIGI